MDLLKYMYESYMQKTQGILSKEKQQHPERFRKPYTVLTQHEIKKLADNHCALECDDAYNIEDCSKCFMKDHCSTNTETQLFIISIDRYITNKLKEKGKL